MITRREELEEKKRIFESKSDEQRINEFIENNPPYRIRSVDDWFEEHQKLTGSCWMGGYKWIKAKGFKRCDMYSTIEFLNYVNGAYGGEIISNLLKLYATPSPSTHPKNNEK